MSATLVPVGNFKGWLDVIQDSSRTMAWNWKPLLSTEFALAPAFPAVAIGLLDDAHKTFVVRTPPVVSNDIVGPLIGLVMREQHYGASIAVSLRPCDDSWVDDQQYPFWVCQSASKKDPLSACKRDPSAEQHERYDGRSIRAGRDVGRA